MDGDAALKSRPSLDAAFEDAHIPTLVVALTQLTGDASWLDGERPIYMPFGDGQGDLSPTFQTRVRTAAKAALAQYQQGARLPSPPSPATVRGMMDYLAGQEIPEHYVPFLMEELALEGVDAKRPHWETPKLKAAAARLKLLIIGAGMSGLLTAIRLKQAGIDFEIVEKNADVGGTWLENTYPGVRVDTPNHLYSYSFEPNHDWPYRYSTGDVLLAYFQRTADKHGLRPHIRFETTVTDCRFDEVEGLWRTHVKGKDGKAVEIVSNAVVTRRRPAEPAAHAGHRRNGSLQGRRLPLSPVARRLRSQRQDGGGDRHGRQRLPVRAQDRAGG